MSAWLAWTFGLITLTWAQRELRAGWRERRFLQRSPPGGAGLIRVADPRTYGARTERALLLLHGYNDSPYSVDHIARAVHAAGWTVRVPLLPGHGRTLRAFDA